MLGFVYVVADHQRKKKKKKKKPYYVKGTQVVHRVANLPLDQHKLEVLTPPRLLTLPASFAARALEDTAHPQ
eukprot:1761690-Alexandrium_andersonii.AAC.1